MGHSVAPSATVLISQWNLDRDPRNTSELRECLPRDRCTQQVPTVMCPTGGLLSEFRLLIKGVMLWLEHKCPWGQGHGLPGEGCVGLGECCQPLREVLFLTILPALCQTCLFSEWSSPPLPTFQPDTGCHSASVISRCPSWSSQLS